MKNSDYLDRAMRRCVGVTFHPYRLGGAEYRLGTREPGDVGRATALLRRSYELTTGRRTAHRGEGAA